MIKYLSCFVLIFATHTTLFSQFNPNSFQQYITNNDKRDSKDVIQEFPEFHAHINWSKAQVVTEHQIPVSYNDPNIGRNVATLTHRLKRQLSDFMYSAVKKVQVSSVFFVDDFLKRDPQIEVNIMSRLLALNVRNNVVRDSYVRGQMVFPLYGADSLSEPFYQNIKQTRVTNYLQREAVSSVHFDTLIIDMVMFEKFQATLMPRVIDQNGNLLHGVETLDRNTLSRQGPVHYVSSVRDAFAHPARGENVAYILPENVSGFLNSDIVLFNADARRIFSQQRTINALQKGNVIIIVNVEKKK
ncbi:MAG: hypothetical protein ACRCS8_03620 [Brevinema sp.]